MHQIHSEIQRNYSSRIIKPLLLQDTPKIYLNHSLARLITRGISFSAAVAPLNNQDIHPTDCSPPASQLIPARQDASFDSSFSQEFASPRFPRGRSATFLTSFPFHGPLQSVRCRKLTLLSIPINSYLFRATSMIHLVGIDRVSKEIDGSVLYFANVTMRTNRLQSSFIDSKVGQSR